MNTFCVAHEVQTNGRHPSHSKLAGCGVYFKHHYPCRAEDLPLTTNATWYQTSESTQLGDLDPTTYPPNSPIRSAALVDPRVDSSSKSCKASVPPTRTLSSVSADNDVELYGDSDCETQGLREIVVQGSSGGQKRLNARFTNRILEILL